MLSYTIPSGPFQGYKHVSPWVTGKPTEGHAYTQRGCTEKTSDGEKLQRTWSWHLWWGKCHSSHPDCVLSQQTNITNWLWLVQWLFHCQSDYYFKANISRSVPTNLSTYQDHSYFSYLQSISAPTIISHHPYKPVADPVRLQPWNNFLSFLYFGAKRKIKKKQILNSASNPDKLYPSVWKGGKSSCPAEN